MRLVSYSQMNEKPGLLSASELQHVQEIAWLKDNLAAFWTAAYEGYQERGRGALIIDTRTTPLGEETPFYYITQDIIDAQPNDASQLLASWLDDYEPGQQIVVVFVRPGQGDTRYSLFQLELIELLVETAEAYQLPEPCSQPSPTNQPEQEPDAFDSYQAAMVIYNQVVEFLQQRGDLLRPSQITSEFEQDDHFDTLARLYKETLLFLGLDWPPPVRDASADKDIE